LCAAQIAADRVREAFEIAAKEIDGMPIGGTVSIGAVATEDADCDIDALLAMADKALYAAKAGGRNRVVAYTSDMDEAPLPEKAGPAGHAPEERRGQATLAPTELSLAIAAARAKLKSAA
jgi:hypothetical protein